MERNAPREAVWIDQDGFVRAPVSGTKLARVDAGVLYLYDKSLRRNIPVTPEDLARMLDTDKTSFENIS